jgi:hypothetical protein
MWNESRSSAFFLVSLSLLIADVDAFFFVAPSQTYHQATAPVF